MCLIFCWILNWAVAIWSSENKFLSPFFRFLINSLGPQPVTASEKTEQWIKYCLAFKELMVQCWWGWGTLGNWWPAAGPQVRWLGYPTLLLFFAFSFGSSTASCPSPPTSSTWFSAISSSHDDLTSSMSSVIPSIQMLSIKIGIKITKLIECGLCTFGEKHSDL